MKTYFTQDLTVDKLKSDPYFRTLNAAELGYYVARMNRSEYGKLLGEKTGHKAANLYNELLMLPAVKAPEEKPALKAFAGYEIQRHADTVSFGCGAVEVYKKDLVVLATSLQEDPTFKDKARAIIRLVLAAKSEYSSENILAIEPETLLAIAGL